MGREHSWTLTAANNASWLLLTLGRPEALEGFERCLKGRTDPTDWLHHWARFGVALCEGLTTGDLDAAEAVIVDLIDLLGANHDRVANGRDKIAMVQKLREAKG